MTAKACAECEFFEAHGRYPDGVRWHCDDGCHQTGYGAAELHCSGMNGSGCHRTFGSETVFTAHQTEHGCRDPLDLKTRDGKRRFKAIERSGKLVWVRTDAYGDGETPKPFPRPVQGDGRVAASKDRYVLRSRGVA